MPSLWRRGGSSCRATFAWWWTNWSRHCRSSQPAPPKRPCCLCCLSVCKWTHTEGFQYGSTVFNREKDANTRVQVQVKDWLQKFEWRYPNRSSQEIYYKERNLYVNIFETFFLSFFFCRVLSTASFKYGRIIIIYLFWKSGAAFHHGTNPIVCLHNIEVFGSSLYIYYQFNLQDFQKDLAARADVVVAVAGYKHGGLCHWKCQISCKQTSPFPCVLHSCAYSHIQAYMFSHTHIHTHSDYASVKVHDASATHLPTRLHLKMRCSSHFLSIFRSVSTYCDQSVSVTRHTVWLECHFLSGDIWIIGLGQQKRQQQQQHNWHRCRLFVLSCCV